jgi:O-antigen ligase
VGKMQYEEYPLKVLFGFGVGEYEWGNREYFVIARDVSAMSFNNFTNARSSLIHYFAEMGLIGILLLFYLYIVIWQYFKNTEFTTILGKTMKIIYAPFILSSFVLGFIYQGLQFNNSYPIFTFWILMALTVKFEMLENEPQNI